MTAFKQAALAEHIQSSVQLALAEDLGNGDITAALIAEDSQSIAQIISREKAVFCGKPWCDQVFAQLDGRVAIQWLVNDGDRLSPEQVICRIHGAARALLSGERTALNFMQTLSGTATLAQKFVDAVAGTNCTILDTRKTIPGLRMAQKYAVHCGGATNHRMGLYDGILIKENHIAACGSITAAIASARLQSSEIAIEVEVENLSEVQEALTAGADILLLDNMKPEQLRQAVKFNAGRAKLEASGGVDLTTIRAIAETGVDYISIGAITKHVHATDLSMRFMEQQREGLL